MSNSFVSPPWSTPGWPGSCGTCGPGTIGPGPWGPGPWGPGPWGPGVIPPTHGCNSNCATTCTTNCATSCGPSWGPGFPCFPGWGFCAPGGTTLNFSTWGNGPCCFNNCCSPCGNNANQLLALTALLGSCCGGNCCGGRRCC